MKLSWWALRNYTGCASVYGVGETEKRVPAVLAQEEAPAAPTGGGEIPVSESHGGQEES